MKEYKVTVETMVRQDILKIRRYISNILKEPKAAKRIYDSIKAEILTLDKSPKRYPVIDEAPYASLGVRRLLVENYIAFYLVNEQKGKVQVLRVLYNRREWQGLLREN